MNNEEIDAIDASMDDLLERLELVGIELAVLREGLDSISDRLTLLQIEVNEGF
jgi:hypothetical protein